MVPDIALESGLPAYCSALLSTQGAAAVAKKGCSFLLVYGTCGCGLVAVQGLWLCTDLDGQPEECVLEVHGQ